MVDYPLIAAAVKVEKLERCALQTMFNDVSKAFGQFKPETRILLAFGTQAFGIQGNRPSQFHGAGIEVPQVRRE
jgi:hypothetical protein